MAKRGLLSGNKFSGRHTTYNSLAEEVIKLLKPHDDVKKIVLGPIKPVRASQKRVKVSEEKGQVRIQCRDVGSVQLLWAIGLGPERVKEILERLLP